MAVKTFTDNTSLPASDINTYLNNGGLVYITQATISASSSYTFTNCFSSTYNNYRVVVNSLTGSIAASNLRIRIANATPGYYGSYYYDLYTGAGTSTTRFNNAAQFQVAGYTNANDEGMSTFDICNPQTAKRTSWTGNFYGDGYSGWFGGTLANSTQYTDLQFLPNAGTFTAIIRIYGYREA